MDWKPEMNMELPGFEDMVEVPENDALCEVADLVNRQVMLEDVVASLEEKLRDASDQLREVSMVLLPDAMRAVGLSSVDLDSGERVQIKHNVKASITAAKREGAFAWLRENGFGAIIKPKVVEENVHPQTLSAFAREQLDAGRPLPEEHFSIFEYDQCKIRRA